MPREAVGRRASRAATAPRSCRHAMHRRIAWLLWHLARRLSREPAPAAPLRRGQQERCEFAALLRVEGGVPLSAGTCRHRSRQLPGRCRHSRTVRQLTQGVEGGSAADRRIVSTMHELEELNRKLHIAVPPGPRLSSRSERPRLAMIASERSFKRLMRATRSRCTRESQTCACAASENASPS